jgi:hypothetical protein
MKISIYNINKTGVNVAPVFYVRRRIWNLVAKATCVWHRRVGLKPTRLLITECKNVKIKLTNRFLRTSPHNICSGRFPFFRL